MLNVWIGNLGKYNEGELVGDWLNLPVSKKELAEQVWHFQGPDPEADIPEDFIKRLRKKLLSFGSTALIETVWGFGYRMSERKPEGIESI